MPLEHLPTLNAALNGASALCLVAGYWLIRRGRWRAHRNAMVAAVALSGLFLTSYLIYHYQVGSVRFQSQGWIRPVYFTILISHTLLAAAVPFLAIATLYRAFRRRFDRHRSLGRLTLPIWLYVSVTGVVIYVLLYWVDR